MVVATGVQQAVLLAGFGVTANQGQPPTITDFNPKSASIGAAVTLTGTNLVTPGGVAGDVRLAKLGGEVVSAPLTAASAISLSFVIPSVGEQRVGQCDDCRRYGDVDGDADCGSIEYVHDFGAARDVESDRRTQHSAR